MYNKKNLENYKAQHVYSNFGKECFSFSADESPH